MIEKQNFILYTGKTRTIRIPVVDIDGEPFDFTGWSLKWNLRTSNATGTLVITKISGAGVTETDGTVSINLAVVDTDTLAIGGYYHELSASQGDAEYDICNGQVTLKKSGN